MAIPKIIHQTFYDASALPDPLKINRLKLQQQNPGWDFRFYSDEDCFDFIRANYTLSILAAYNSINPLYGPARADLFRYLLLYKLGGVYLDIKSTAMLPLDSIVKNYSYLLSHWDNRGGDRHEGWGMHFRDLSRGEFQQWHIACEPEHPFLKAVILLVLHNIQHYSTEKFGVGKWGVLNTTGPVAYTTAISRVMTQVQQDSILIADTHHDLALCYSVYDEGGVPREHEKHVARRAHYTQLTDPVVLR